MNTITVRLLMEKHLLALGEDANPKVEATLLRFVADLIDSSEQPTPDFDEPTQKRITAIVEKPSPNFNGKTFVCWVCDKTQTCGGRGQIRCSQAQSPTCHLYYKALTYRGIYTPKTLAAKGGKERRDEIIASKKTRPISGNTAACQHCNSIIEILDGQQKFCTAKQNPVCYRQRKRDWNREYMRRYVAKQRNVQQSNETK